MHAREIQSPSQSAYHPPPLLTHDTPELLTPSNQLTESCLETMAANAWCPGLEVLHVYSDSDDTSLPTLSAPHDLLARTLGAHCAALRVLKFEGCGSLCMDDGFIRALARTAPLEELRLSVSK